MLEYDLLAGWKRKRHPRCVLRTQGRARCARPLGCDLPSRCVSEQSSPGASFHVTIATLGQGPRAVIDGERQSRLFFVSGDLGGSSM